MALAMTKYGGVGRHLPALELTDPTKIVSWAKFLIAVEWIYLAAAILPKLAILSMYLRIFTTRSYRRSVYVLAVVLIMTFLAGGLTGSLGCQPLAFFWDSTIPGGHCININAFFRWISLPNIVTDIAMLVLPQPLIWTLQATRNQKIGLTLTFLTGSVGLIASIFRFTTFFQNDAITDGTFASVDLMSWTIIEPGIYLLAACLPPLRPLLHRIAKAVSHAYSSKQWTPKDGDGDREGSTADIKLQGLGGLRSENHHLPSGFHRLADGGESIGNRSEDETSLVGNYSSAKENDRQPARNNRGEDRKAPHIRVDHDVLVTTSDSLASSSHELKGRVFDVGRSV